MKAKCIKDGERRKSMGYVEYSDWLELMCKKYDQRRCNDCGLWHIFKKKHKST